MCWYFVTSHLFIIFRGKDYIFFKSRDYYSISVSFEFSSFKVYRSYRIFSPPFSVNGTPFISPRVLFSLHQFFFYYNSRDSWIIPALHFFTVKFTFPYEVISIFPLRFVFSFAPHFTIVDYIILSSKSVIVHSVDLTSFSVDLLFQHIGVVRFDSTIIQLPETIFSIKMLIVPLSILRYLFSFPSTEV